MVKTKLGRGGRKISEGTFAERLPVTSYYTKRGQCEGPSIFIKQDRPVRDGDNSGSGTLQL